MCKAYYGRSSKVENCYRLDYCNVCSNYIVFEIHIRWKSRLKKLAYIVCNFLGKHNCSYNCLAMHKLRWYKIQLTRLLRFRVLAILLHTMWSMNTSNILPWTDEQLIWLLIMVQIYCSLDDVTLHLCKRSMNLNELLTIMVLILQIWNTFLLGFA